MKTILLVLLLAAGAAGFAEPLQAQVIENTTPFSFATGQFAINVNGSTLFTGGYDHTGGGVNNDWVVSTNMYGGGFELEYANSSAQWLTGGAVPYGTLIGSGGTYGGNFGTPTSSFTNAYYGIDYTLSPGNVEYGWVALSFDSVSGTGTIVSAALDTTPNEAISVGAVPEPLGLAPLGLGVLAFVISRRKKSA